MKKVLLSTAAAAGLLSVASAEIGSGFFVGLKGGMNIFNIGGKGVGVKASEDKSANPANDFALDLGGFGVKGWNVGVETGYSYRTQGGFTIGGALFAGYNNNVFGTVADLDGKTTADIKKDDVLGSSVFDLSGFDAQLRVRIGYAFSKFHIFLDPGFATTFSNPKSGIASIGVNGDKLKKTDATFAEIKDTTFMSKSAFVAALNFNHGITPSMYYGVSVGVRMNFADAKGLNNGKDVTAADLPAGAPATSLEASKGITAPMGLEVGLTFGANF